MNTVKQLLDRNGVLQKEFAIDIGVSQPTVSDWIHNKKDPRGENLQKVADYFGVSIGVIKGVILLPEYIARTSDVPDITDIDFALSGEIRDLSDAEKQDVLDYVRFKRAQKAKEAKQ